MEQKMIQLLQNCKTIKEFKQTHLQILIHGLKNRQFIIPKLINLSSSLISIDYATKIFHTSFNPNTVAYNTIIKCFIGRPDQPALRIYNRMKASKIEPSSFTFTFLLKCFASKFEAFGIGMEIHCDVLKLGFGSSLFVMNTLLDFYAKCGAESLDFACWVFEEMPERDVVTWNAMIGAYVARGEIDNAMKFFYLMPEKNIVSWNSVVVGISKAGNMDLARSLFQQMPERNEVSWNSMISGYVGVGDVQNAQYIFDQMPLKSVVSWTVMVSGYTKIGDLDSAFCIFNQMPNKNVVSWNAMISGLVHNDMFDRALRVFQSMLADGKCRPDQLTLISVLSACTHLRSLQHGKWIDFYIKKHNFDLSIPLGNALIDLFSKCGDIINAVTVFNRMHKKCIITWTTIVSGLAVNGKCKEALAIYDKMLAAGMKPDDVIFIVVLSACTHGGFVEEGKTIYTQMINEFNIKPRIEHYGCMVDLLGRAGRLEEAVRFLESMHLEPNAVIWATLLFSCKLYGKGDLLESLSKKLIDQEPSNPGYFTLISNLSASMGRWKDALSFRTAMRDQRIEKVPGCSSIEVANRVHEFLAKDTNHGERLEIYGVLDNLYGHMKVVCDVSLDSQIGTLQ